jgi:quinol monooxygenase YgiN
MHGSMSIIIHAEIHGLGGRAPELAELLGEHTTRLNDAGGCTGATAAQALGADAGEYLLTSRWADEESVRAHYKSKDYTYYITRIGELLARPSDVTISYVGEEVRTQADLSEDPTRQG